MRSVAWDQGGTRLAYAGADRGIHVWDAAIGKQREAWLGHTGEVYAVLWSPDGRRLASGGIDQTVRLWDAETGKEQHVCRGHQAQVYAVAWSPDGRWVASASGDMTIRVWEATTGQESKVLRVHAEQVTSVAWSPDGKWLASTSLDAAIKVANLATGVSLTLAGHTARVNGVAWSPDGKRLASGGEDRTVKIWDATTGKETLTLQSSAQPVKAVAWSPDGNVLLAAGPDGSISVHDATAGYQAARSPHSLAALDRRLAADPTRGADWQLRAEIHTRQGNWDEAAADVEHWLKLQPDRRWCLLDCWVVGPYPEDMRARYSPEKNLDPGEGRATAESAAKAPLLWQSVPAEAQGFVDFGALLGKTDHISAYAVLRVYSPVRQPVALLCGSDDYVRLWLNGKQLHEHLAARRAVPDDDAIAATLEPGWNTLLARVANVTGEHALYWRLSDTPAAMARARGEPKRTR